MIKKSLGCISNRNVFLSSTNANSIMKQLKARTVRSLFTAHFFKKFKIILYSNIPLYCKFTEKIQYHPIPLLTSSQNKVDI